MPMPAPFREPQADRFPLPVGYSDPGHHYLIHDWAWARQRLQDALVYWVGTTRPDGRPYVHPIWGCWLDEGFFFEGGTHTQWARNLARSPAAVVHPELVDEVVVVEGSVIAPPAEPVIPDPDLTERLLAGYAKYRATRNYQADPANWREGIFLLRPSAAHGWADFPADVTRWNFEQPASRH